MVDRPSSGPGRTEHTRTTVTEGCRFDSGRGLRPSVAQR